MNTSLQIRIDSFVIKPLVSLLNIIVITLGKVLRIDHRLTDREFDTIAICKYKGIGSIIQSTPLLRSIRHQYPDAKIIFVSTSGNREFLKNIEEIDEVITLNDSSVINLLKGIIPFVLKLIKSKIQVYIDLEVYSNFSTLITILSLSKNRLGFYLQSKHYRLGNYTHMMYHNTRSPIMETYLQFARLLDCEQCVPTLNGLGAKIKKVDVMDKGLPLSALDYIVVNPNASDLRLERRWEGLKYNALIKKILDNYKQIKIVVIGSKNEAEYVEQVLSNLESERLINVAGKTNLDELISIIDHAKFLITNDSGPMHIAFACKTQTVSLFGPCSPSQYGQHKLNIPVYSNTYCSPCIHDFINPPCKGKNICMDLIEVDEVYDKVRRIFEELPTVSNEKQSIIYKKNDFTIGTLFRNK